MEKINREELMKKLNLTEEEMEKVAGGRLSSFQKCQWPSYEACIANCDAVYEENEYHCTHYAAPSRYDECVKEANDYHCECITHCLHVCL